MVAVSYTVELDTAQAAAVIGALDGAQFRLLMRGIAQRVEGQTKDRILNEKVSPDGAPWANWSQAYVQSKAKRKSLLVATDNLWDSVAADWTEDEARVGVKASVKYAAIHQFGGRGIPARPYLGLSREDRSEIEEIASDFIRSVLQ